MSLSDARDVRVLRNTATKLSRPAAVAAEIEFRRQQLGLSQAQLAARIGRSQGQVANPMRGHDPISAATVNRLRELLLGVPLRPAVA